MKSAREKLRKFYEVHNPEKLSDIDFLLEKYEGREDVLFRKLQRKYERKNPPPSSGC